MIQWVYERASQSAASKILVATDDSRIEEAVKSFGGEVVMTSANHLSGTDRLAEVTDQLGLGEQQIVVNVQGDEPLIPPAVIDQVASNLSENSGCVAATLSHKISTLSEFKDPSAVKVVADELGTALYFSRAPIPWPRDAELGAEELPEDFVPQRHLGIYAYRVGLLQSFVHWPQSELEKTESLEQLRILSQGKNIHVEPCCEPVPAGVDTPEDLERVRAQLTKAKATH
jgi:3-deoxy-manno-octulosonate cytidylyltransferase (CMP-KDO synthetase)